MQAIQVRADIAAAKALLARSIQVSYLATAATALAVAAVARYETWMLL